MSKPDGRRGDSVEVDEQRDWFERLYVMAGDGEAVLPWDRGGPHQLFEDWARGMPGDGRRALVVGCGLGNDSEYVAELGFETVAFDFAATAIRQARERFPDSVVDYHVTDLLDPPAEWTRAFDLVVESLTVQSLPRSFRAEAIARIREFVAPGGTLLAIAGVSRPGDEDPAEGPWRLTREDIESFAVDGLELVRLEEFAGPDRYRWRAELVRG